MIDDWSGSIVGSEHLSNSNVTDLCVSAKVKNQEFYKQTKFQYKKSLVLSISQSGRK